MRFWGDLEWHFGRVFGFPEPHREEKGKRRKVREGGNEKKNMKKKRVQKATEQGNMSFKKLVKIRPTF